MFRRAVFSVVVCLVLVTTAVGCAASAGATGVSQSIERSITVVGEGRASAIPDMAEAHVGVEVLAPTVEEAAAEAEERMAAIMTALQDAGIDEKDIQTSSYSISFDRYPDPRPMRDGEVSQRESQYRVSNMVRVSIRELGTVGAILDEVIAAGANSVYGVNFTVDDPDEVRSQARSKAIVDARAKALELANLTEASLGQVLLVSEVVGGPLQMGGMSVAREYAGAGPISPGELEFSVRIQITYAIGG